MTRDLETLRGPALRDRLYAARTGVRETLLAHPSIALRDAIAKADAEVSAAMRRAIEVYESLAAAPAEASEPAPIRERAGTIDDPSVARLPPPRTLPHARPANHRGA